jgi:hypothetical protein
MVDMLVRLIVAVTVAHRFGRPSLAQPDSGVEHSLIDRVQTLVHTCLPPRSRTPMLTVTATAANPPLARCSLMTLLNPESAVLNRGSESESES